MAFSPTPAYSAPISMYTRHDPSCGPAKVHGGGAWGCQHCTSRSIPWHCTWMDGAVCAWMSMHTACTWSRTNRMGNASMYHVRIHPSIHHAWMDPSMHPSMHDEREREAVWTLLFLMAFSPTPAYSAPISMYTRHDPSCGHAKVHGGGAWGCQHCTSRSIPWHCTWMDGAVCAWMSMHTACTWSRTNRMGNASMYHVRIHPSIHHAWMDPSMHPSMHDEREREAVWTLLFLMAFSPTPAYSAPISMYTRHDPSCGHAKMHGGHAHCHDMSWGEGYACMYNQTCPCTLLLLAWHAHVHSHALTLMHGACVWACTKLIVDASHRIRPCAIMLGMHP